MTRFDVRPVTGSRIRPFIPDLAALRIAVFREYPYLYDGSIAYEEEYLSAYTETEESIIVLVLCEDKIVGASTALPMEAAAAEFQEPFIRKGYAPDRIFYLGESVLLKPFRGNGLYGRLFEGRENHAKESGRFDCLTFCAVDRPADHPQKPPGYVPLDRYWEKRGYARHPDMITHFPWKDLDEDAESLKPMVFWIKSL